MNMNRYWTLGRFLGLAGVALGGWAFWRTGGQMSFGPVFWVGLAPLLGLALYYLIGLIGKVRKNARPTNSAAKRT